MANIQKTFNLLQDNKRERFLTLLTDEKKIIVIDLKSIDYIELDTNLDQIWIGSQIYIHYKNLNYTDSIEEFYSKIVKTWCQYKETI